MSQLICGGALMLDARRGDRYWDAKQLSWQTVTYRYPRANMRLAQNQTIEKVHRYFKLEIVPVRSGANIQWAFGRIDGRHGILAQAELPGTPSGDWEQRAGLFDTAENPGQLQANATCDHEFLHNLGWLHNDDEPSIMNSTLNTDFVDEWDDATIDYGRKYYGKSKTVVPVPDCGTFLDQLCAGLWQVPR